MKLKYYMRGLGIGILVTSVIAGVLGGPEELTDAQIKARAAGLGMVEKASPSELADEGLAEKETSEKEEPAPRETVAAEDEPKDPKEPPAPAEEIKETAETEETKESEETETGGEETEEAEETAADEEETEVTTVSSTGEEEPTETGSVQVEGMENYVIIHVERGNGSDIVAHKMYEAGLIPSAKEYDRYLVENGYDRRLEIGNHEIPAGSTWEEMAQILCAP
ncbi:MAG: hypothetical protein IJC59_05865 [Lachnospiraceae bacterium]|nr:hypothetical protein [Lachnospiraceae bacterium]